MLTDFPEFRLVRLEGGRSPRQVVLQCLSSELKTSISSIYTVVEAPNDVQMMMGSATIRLYEVSDAVGGTLVTLYITNMQTYVDEAKALIARCQSKLAQQ